MAGRPVAARSSGGSGMLYGLIVFVIIAVAALGALVWVLTNQKRVESERNQAQRKIADYGNPPSYYVNEASARGSTVFNVMNSDIQELAKLIHGKSEAVRPALVESSNRLLSEIASTSPNAIVADDTLLTALRRLHGTFIELEQQHKTLRADFDNLQIEATHCAEGKRAAEEAFQAEVASLKAELERIDSEKVEQLDAKDEQLAALEAESEAVREELSNLKIEQQRRDNEHEVTVARLEGDIGDLKKQIEIIRPGGYDAYDILTKADAKVLRALPGSDIVYLDVGSRDRIKPGMNFEIFSADGGDRDRAPGKGTIEVMSAADQTCECRIVRSKRGRPIVENDLAVNIAYERDRKPSFVIRGEFDLDYDGQIDWNGRDKVAAMIRDWGGQITDELNETSDFLVVGLGPQVPGVTENRPISEVVRALVDRAIARQVDFEADLNKAKSLYIPIVPQNQFLYLTGNTPVVQAAP